MVSLKNVVYIHIYYIIWKEQVIFRNTYKYICECDNNERKVMDLKESKESYMGGFGGMKGKGKNL